MKSEASLCVLLARNRVLKSSCSWVVTCHPCSDRTGSAAGNSRRSGGSDDGAVIDGARGGVLQMLDRSLAATEVTHRRPFVYASLLRSRQRNSYSSVL